MVEMVNILRYA